MMAMTTINSISVKPRRGSILDRTKHLLNAGDAGADQLECVSAHRHEAFLERDLTKRGLGCARADGPAHRLADSHGLEDAGPAAIPGPAALVAADGAASPQREDRSIGQRGDARGIGVDLDSTGAAKLPD
jgi:hypothetical protein